MSTNLSPEQARALRVVRNVLELDEHSTDTDAHRAGALRTALQMVAEAFPEDEPPTHTGEGITGMYWDNLGSGGAW